MTTFVLLLALLQPGPSANTQDEATRLFTLGQQLYAEADYEGAVAAFEGALATGWTSAAVHYNLGTACLAAADLGSGPGQAVGCAVLHLERAHRLRPGDATIRHNLRLAHDRADVDLGPRTLMQPLLRAVGLTGLLGLSGAFYVATIGLLSAWFWTRRLVLRRGLIVLAPLAALLIVLSTVAWREHHAPEAVILAAETPVRAAPTPDARERATLRAGHLVRLTAQQGEWAEIRLADGTRGWLPSRTVEAI
ncbi:MAG: SH3 domain-containing protein [Rhodothermaceae bacterium]|nr:SH3 domain-containing protein [Rhodothermaceae bacterium]